MHVKTGEFDAALARLVELAHPFNHLEHLLCVPGPKIHTGDELPEVALTFKHVLIEPVRLGHVGFDRKDGEAPLAGQVLDQPVFHLEHLARPVSTLAERDDASIAHEGLERLEVFKAVSGLGRL